MVRSGVKSEAGAKSPKGGQQQQQQQQRSGNGAGRARKSRAATAKFTGATEALASVVYDVGKDSQSKWTHNQHELEEYALRGTAFDNPLIAPKCVKELTPYVEKTLPIPDFDNMTQKDADGKDVKLTTTQKSVAVRLHEREVEVAGKEARSVQKDVTALYGQVLGQCTPAMRRLLESHSNWPTIDAPKDPVELLKAIQSIMYGQQTHQYLPLTLHQAMRSTFTIIQGRSPVEDHYKKFVAVMESNEAVGTVELAHPSLVEQLLQEKVGSNTQAATDAQREEARLEAISRSNAMAFMCSLDKNRYGELLTTLSNELLKGRNNYPETVEAALTMAVNYRSNGGGTGDTTQQSALLFNQEDSNEGGNSRSRNRRGRRDCQCERHSSPAPLDEELHRGAGV